jgi:hypothetical protein
MPKVYKTNPAAVLPGKVRRLAVENPDGSFTIPVEVVAECLRFGFSLSQEPAPERVAVMPVAVDPTPEPLPLKPARVLSEDTTDSSGAAEDAPPAPRGRGRTR